MYVGGQHINPADMQCRAPLNPVLGETVQRVLPDGTKFYAEQTSHHPPVTNFLLDGPNNLYRFSGYFEYKAWLSGLSSIGGSRIGKQIISFNDGGLISIKDPSIEISGLTYGDRVHNMQGNLIIIDHINKLEAVVTYNPQREKSVLKSFRNKLWKSSSSVQPTDLISIVITQKANNSSSKAKVVVSEGQGSWLEYIDFDGQQYWSIDEE
jgi:hypothetical protein